MADLNTLIAMGGTQVKSPIQRYEEARMQMAQEQQNQLAMEAQRQQIAASQQAMGINQEEHQAKKLENYGKSVVPFIEWVNKQPDKQMAYQQVLPQMRSVAGQLGIPVESMSNQWNQQMGDSLISRFGEKKKSQYFQAVDPSDPKAEPKPAQEINGLVYDTAGKPQPTWVEAPKRQQTAGSEGFGKQEDKLAAEQLNYEQNTYNLVAGLDSLTDFVKSPNYVGGTTGDIISTGNSMVQQFRQFTGLGDTGGNIPDTEIEGEKGKTTYSKFRKSANEGDQRAALTIELAYNIAKSFDRGGRVTDADFKFAKRLIDGSADRRSTLASIDDFRKRSILKYNISDELFSKKSGRPSSKFSEDKYRELTGRASEQKETPMSDIDIKKQELYKKFGVM